MNRKELFDFYKELYFFETDRREKLSMRLNVPLAVIVGLVGFMSSMLENVPNTIQGASSRTFCSFFTFAGVAVGSALWNIKRLLSFNSADL